METEQSPDRTFSGPSIQDGASPGPTSVPSVHDAIAVRILELRRRIVILQELRSYLPDSINANKDIRELLINITNQL